MRRTSIQKLNGQVSVSRYHGSNTGVTITVEDETSGCIIVECDLTIEQFGDLISGLSFIPCKMEVNTSGNIGKKRENKTVDVSMPGTGVKNILSPKQIIAKHEVDGWIGRPADLENFHNKNEDGTYRVSFVRELVI